MFTQLIQFNLDKKLSYEESYIKENLHLANKVEYLYCIPNYLCLAQAQAESKMGRSRLAQDANNHFGIKWWKNCGQNYHRTVEGGAKWRCYPAVKQSFLDYGNFFESLNIKIPNYPRGDYKRWCRWVAYTGYAGRSQEAKESYRKLLIDIVVLFNLHTLPYEKPRRNK